MEVNLNRAERMLFALLRASLHRLDVDTSCFESIEASDWKQCYHLACLPDAGAAVCPAAPCSGERRDDVPF